MKNVEVKDHGEGRKRRGKTIILNGYKIFIEKY